MQSPRMHPTPYSPPPPPILPPAPPSLLPTASPPVSPRMTPGWPARTDMATTTTATAAAASTATSPSSLLFAPVSPLGMSTTTTPALSSVAHPPHPPPSPGASAYPPAPVASGLSNLWAGHPTSPATATAPYELPREKRQRMTAAPSNVATSSVGGSGGGGGGTGFMGRMSPRPMAMHHHGGSSNNYSGNSGHHGAAAAMPISRAQSPLPYVNPRFGGHSPPAHGMFVDPSVRSGSPPFRHAPLFGRSPPIHYSQPTGATAQVPAMPPLPPTSSSAASSNQPPHGSFRRNSPSAS
ncbi:hypothetical protein SYNPS1DRAFT_29611 [Syncephalis pseudoplumigaleata]|uniref:Uncharacterized protein n=1 Tax=Syncephalis pseudoplumigaleata TaxID=1712513 RepID=A0A4P9YYI5_9FUNG|nr:hypothetical protein SYNPS1DRAFT_29611 [Syncephalis pseudoplumigaleata]|eukprot:RKP24632.1 hypothetical protein SYNPS1DRAFT_29611 [Syncephalis pseudoplumigaleata]